MCSSDLEREEQRSDGSWGDATVVGVLPGVASFRGVALPNVGAVVDLMKANAGMQERILRPPFPGLVPGGSSDGPAGAPASAAAESKELAAARKSLEEARKRLAEATTKLDEAGGEYNDAPQPPKGRGGRGGGGSSGEIGRAHV